MVANPANGEPRPDGEDDEEPEDDPGDLLTLKHERAIVALLNEQMMARAAAAVGVSHRTLNRWLDKPAFSQAYRKARREGGTPEPATAESHGRSVFHRRAAPCDVLSEGTDNTG